MILIKSGKILRQAIACLFLCCLSSAVSAQPSPKNGQRLQLRDSMPSLSPREAKWLNSLPSMPLVIKQYIATTLPEMSLNWVENSDNPISVGNDNDFNKDGKRDVIVRIETRGTGGDLMFVFISQDDTFTIEYCDTNIGIKFLSNGFDSQVHGGRCNDVGSAPCFQSHTWRGGRFIGGKFRRNPM
jgi:hypothetical protein